MFGKRLGLEEAFLSQTAETVIKQMKHVYPELGQREEFILKVIQQEETRFAETLNTGLALLEGLLSYREGHRKAIPELVLFLQDSKHASEIPAKVLEQHGFVGGGLETGSQVGFEMAAETISRFTSELQVSLLFNLASKELVEKIKQWGQTISGSEVFKLYDTYGFPVELTKEIAAERGFTIDLDGFENEMEQQRERAKAAHKFTSNVGGFLTQYFFKSEFIGYKKLSVITKIESINFGRQSRLEQGQEGSIVLSKTPFYGEMGGQVGDTGEILSDTGRFLVTRTDRILSEILVHHGQVAEGSFSVGDRVTAEVDKERRLDIERNHTATHLLQAALRQVLGEHIQQRGSLVAPERFRFDFSHLVAMTKEEIGQVQEFVNEKIRQNLKVYDEQMPYKTAIAAGVTALFDEKYGDTVRVLRIGKPPVSAELCGGTHAGTTGEIGFFHILSESSVGAGLRRIEAVTGRGAENYFNQRLMDLEKVAGYLDAKPDDVVTKAQNLVEELKNERRKSHSLESRLAKKDSDALEGQAIDIGGIKVLAKKVESTSIDNLREMSDNLRIKLGDAVVILGTVWEDKPAFVANTTLAGYDAGAIVRVAAAVTGGSGGGKKTMAQGGGKDISKIDEALEKAVEYIKKQGSS